MTKDRQKLWTAVITAVVTTAITVGIPALIDRFKPDETVNVVLQDLRESHPQQFSDYVNSELNSENKVVMTLPEEQLIVNGKALRYYLLEDERYVPLSPLLQAAGDAISETDEGIVIASPAMQDNTGKQPIPTGKSWIGQCAPYEKGDFILVSEADGESFSITGQEYTEGLICKTAWDSACLFNTDGKYSSLVLSIGHVDGSTMADGKFSFYVDSELVKAVTVKADALLTEFEIPLSYGKQLKIASSSSFVNYAKYGFVNGVFLP